MKYPTISSEVAMQLRLEYCEELLQDLVCAELGEGDVSIDDAIIAAQDYFGVEDD
jgi:hypothetical protein